MERIAIVARLKDGKEPDAADLIAGGPPFDLVETGIVHHSVYLSAGEVVFVFEGHEVEWAVADLIDNPFQPKLRRAFEQWRGLVDGPPRIARERFGWQRAETEAVTEAVAPSGTGT